MKKKLLMALIAAALIAIVVYQYPRKLHKEMSGYEICHHEDIPVVKKDIVIDGWMKNNLFRKDEFRGKIIVDEIEIVISEYIKINTNDDFGELVHTINDSGDFSTHGTLYSTKGLSQIVILIHEMDDKGCGSFSPDEGSILSAPADTVDEAIDLVDAMLDGTPFDYIDITNQH